MTRSEQQQIIDIQVRYEDAIYGVMRFKDKIDDLKNSQEELKKQLEQGEITLEEYKKQTTATDAVITQYKDNVRVLRKELQNNLRQEQEQTGSLKQLRAELSNATKAYDELSRAEREGAKGKELQNHINEITDELKEAEEATQRFYRNVGNYQESINQAIFGNSKFGQSLSTISTEVGEKGMAAALETAKGKISAFGSAVIGMVSNPYFLALAGVAGAGMAFKWFYDYNQSIQEATRLTQQFTGATGNELKSIRVEVQALADGFGLDFQETLQAANSMAQGFGISIAEALQQMQAGLVSGANANNEFLDTLREYPVYFREAGLTAEQFVAITTNATKQGIFSDKGVDAIKEANLRIREMTTATAEALDGIGISSQQVQADLQSGSKTTFDIMQEVANKLKELPESSSKVGTAIADIFGGPGEDAGLAYLKTLGDVELSMEKVKAGAGGIAEAQERQINANKELQTRFAALFDITGGGFEKMKADLTTIGTKALTKVIDGVISFLNECRSAYNELALIRAIVASVSVGFTTAAQTAKFLFNFLVDNLKSVGRSFTAFGTIIEGAFSLDTDKIKKGFSDLFDNVKLTQSEIKKDFENYGDSIGRSIIDGANTVLGKNKLKPIALPTSASGGTTRGTKTTTGGTTTTTTTATTTGGTSGGTSASATNVNAAKMNAEQLKTLEKQLQEDIARIQAESQEKIIAAKQMYLNGLYEDEKDYERDLENIQREELNAMLNTYTQAGVIGENKAREVSEKLLDISIKFKEEQKKILDQQAQDAADATAKQAEKQKKIMEEAQRKATGYANMFTSAISSAFDEMFEEQGVSFKSFMKSILTTTLDAIEKQLLAYEASILAKEIANKSWTGVASAAALTALITAAFSAAKAGIKSFSTGGYVSGEGTSTSDSIDAKLSNGESVMTANATSMFSPLLSALNQLGGGVPITVAGGGGNGMGEDMLAAAVARGYAMCPAPVVTVEEINRVQRQVQVIERHGRA